jgi:hypothetical protein
VLDNSNQALSFEAELSKSRKLLLDILEASCGSQANWPAIRSQVLNIFGEKGLARFLKMEGDTRNSSMYGDGANQSRNNRQYKK